MKPTYIHKFKKKLTTIYFVSIILKIFGQYQKNYYLHLQGMVFGKYIDMYCCWPSHTSMEETKLKYIISSSLYISASYVDNFECHTLQICFDFGMTNSHFYEHPSNQIWCIDYHFEIFIPTGFFKHLWNEFLLYDWIVNTDPLWSNHNSLICNFWHTFSKT